MADEISLSIMSAMTYGRIMELLVKGSTPIPDVPTLVESRLETPCEVKVVQELVRL